MKRLLFLSCLLFHSFTILTAQTVSTTDSVSPAVLNWHLKDPAKEKVMGTAVEQAYETILRNRKPAKKIIVAVIDSGIDTAHADLNAVIWRNPREIPGNNTDDDGNGYVDDIHGWNFLGNSSGENITYENYEETRIVRKYRERFRNVTSADGLSPAEAAEFRMYEQASKWLAEELKKHEGEKRNIENFEKNLKGAENIIRNHLGKENYTVAELRSISASGEVKAAQQYLVSLYDRGYSASDLEEYKKRNSQFLDYHLNLNYNPRTITGDDPENINDRNYGNNNVKGDRAEHGTFVAGLIGALRNNGFGINGIAESVEIMSLRAVPSGDERDKDIALAIRYAVDNGAKIINMSFGKNYSPEKQLVDDAVKYAESKGVLLVHAAGNNGENSDVRERYPTRRLNDGTIASNWLEVGASSREEGKELPGIFSNYGKKAVDLFAPGVELASLHPENRYDVGDGTSYASPVVAGIAALVWSYYPDLKYSELREILLSSVTDAGREKVYVPGMSSTKRDSSRFSELSVTGGLVNAYKALEMAGRRK